MPLVTAKYFTLPPFFLKTLVSLQLIALDVVLGQFLR